MFNENVPKIPAGGNNNNNFGNKIRGRNIECCKRWMEINLEVRTGQWNYQYQMSFIAHLSHLSALKSVVCNPFFSNITILFYLHSNRRTYEFNVFETVTPLNSIHKNVNFVWRGPR